MGAIVRTVLRDIDPGDLGVTLCHEHLAVDAREGFRDPDVYLDNPEQVAEDLLEAKQHGLRSVVDTSTIGLHRDVGALVRIAELTGLHVLAAAGFYHGHFLPAYVAEMEVEELAEVNVREVEEGIDGTAVRAGVIGEVGASVGEITPVERRLFVAAGRAQRATGACVITHTDVGKMAIEQIDLLEEGGADPSRVLVGHMDCNPDLTAHLAVAERGAYVGFDRIGALRFQPNEVRVRTIVGLLERGHAERVILSGDLARQSRLLRGGGRGYGHVLRDFVPRLRAAGVDEATLHTVLVENPRRLLAFSPRE